MILLPVLEAVERETLPVLYDRWLLALMPRGIPREKRSDCQHCPQVSAGETGSPKGEGFAASTKCCTYVPDLPNYSVGGVLIDGNDGIETLRQRIELSPGSVTPLGLLRTELYQAVYAATRDGAFGRAELLLCPHYIAAATGTCSIWRHRNHVCSTWFCLHERGSLGRSFWIALKELLGEVERQLSALCAQEVLGSTWCIFESGRRPRGTPAALANEVVGRGVGSNESKLWGRWESRKEEFFVECYRYAETLTWDSVVSHLGAVGRSQAESVKAEYERMLAAELPSTLLRGTLRATSFGQNGTLKLVGPGSLDAVDLSSEAAAALGAFDGRPTAEVLLGLAPSSREALTPSILFRLLDVGALVQGPN